MIKLGTLLAVATSSTSAVASPYVVSYANIDLDRKEYSADKFINDVSFFIQNKYEAEISQEYNNNIIHLLASGQDTHDAAFRNAIEDKIEEAYLSDPFKDGGLVFDPTDDMRYNIANIITNWFDQNPTWGVGQSTVGLVSAISSISVGSTGATFNSIEDDFDAWITSIRNFGVAQNNFNDIESSMQTVVDNESVHDSPYYMDINEFYDWTSDEIMNGRNHDTIKNEMNAHNSGEAINPGKRIDELQFNVTDNLADFNNLVNGRQVILENIADDFAIDNDFRNISSRLDVLDTNIYQNFVDDLIDDVSTSMNNMNILDAIGESYVDVTSSDLSKFFEKEDADKFIFDDYPGAEVNVISTGTGGSSVEVLFQIIDTNDAIIHEVSFDTEYESDVFKVENFIDSMDWTFAGVDDQDLKNIQIEDESIPLTSQQLDLLYDTYVEGVEDDYPLVTVIATHQLIQVPNEERYNFIVTFDISKDSTSVQVIKEHEIAIFDNELEETIDRIREQLQDVEISELMLKMDGHTSDVDLLAIGSQARYLGEDIQYSPDVVLDKFTLVYDPSSIYHAGFTTILVSVSNPKSSEEIIDRSIQVNIRSAVEQARVLMDGASFKNLYKEYVQTWFINGTDIKSFALQGFDVVPEEIWILQHMLSSIMVNRNITLSSGEVEVDLEIVLTNGDNNERDSWVTTTRSLIHNSPLTEAEATFAAYEFNDPLNIDEQLLAIVDLDNPTPDEMNVMIIDFLNNIDYFLNLVVDGPDPIGVSIGGIQDMDSAPYNELTLMNMMGESIVVTIQYDTNLVSGAEVEKFREEMEAHINKVDYILSELVAEENIIENNYLIAQNNFILIRAEYDLNASSTDNDEWEDFKGSITNKVYLAFGNAWSGEGSNTFDIIEDIHSDYPDGTPSSIVDRIEEYTAGITMMPYLMDYLDTDDLDTVVDTILALTKTAFLVEPIEIDFAGKIMIFASGITLSVVSGMALISTARILITQRKLKQLVDPTIRYSSPKKLVAFSAISALVAAGASITLMVYIFVTKGGL